MFLLYCKSKMFGGTSENVVKPEYDVTKMAANLNLHNSTLSHKIITTVSNLKTKM